MLILRGTTLLSAVALVALSALMPTPAEASTKVFTNCTAMHKADKDGVVCER